MPKSFTVQRAALSLSYDLDVLESSSDDVLEKLAAYSTCANKQDPTRLEFRKKLWLQDAFGESAAWSGSVCRSSFRELCLTIALYRCSSLLLDVKTVEILAGSCLDGNDPRFLRLLGMRWLFENMHGVLLLS